MATMSEINVYTMNIPLKPNANPIKQWSYQLKPWYKEKVKAELDQMMDAGIIEPIWVDQPNGSTR